MPAFGATTELVYVRFHIEKKGALEGDVKPEQLRVLEDRRPQTIAVLAPSEVKLSPACGRRDDRLDRSDVDLDEIFFEEAVRTAGKDNTVSVDGIVSRSPPAPSVRHDLTRP